MKKSIMAIMVLSACTVCLFAPALAEEDKPIVIIVNGVVMRAGPVPFIEENEVMVPVKSIAEAMGFKVTGWDAYRAHVHDEVHNIQVIVDVVSGSNDRMFSAGDGRRREIDNSVPPMKVGNHIFVPLRSFAEAFDYNVQWDENAKTATLTNQLDIPFFAGKEANVAHSLLSDRLVIFMPEGAESQNAHFGGLMGGEVGGETEIDLVLFGNGQTLTVNVSELYMYSTGDINSDALLFIEFIHANPNSELRNTSFEPVQISDATVVIKPIITDAIDSDFIMGALVRAVDDTLIVVKIYADQKAMTYPEDCISLSLQIIESAQAGTRSLRADGQVLDIGSYTIQVAPGYVPFISDLYHYVWHFTELVTIGDTPSSFGIYRGNHPSYDDSQRPTETVRDIVLSRIVTWRIFTDAPGHFDENSYAEAVIRTGISGWDTYMHIYAFPTSESNWETIREMVRSLRDEDGTATTIIWLLYGLTLVLFLLVLLLVIRKLRKIRITRETKKAEDITAPGE